MSAVVSKDIAKAKDHGVHDDDDIILNEIIDDENRGLTDRLI